MPQSIEHQFSDRWPPAVWQDVVVVVALSGGADSVAMLRALARLSADPRANLVVAHFNHQLRERSTEDEHFAAELAHRLQLRCEIGRATTNLREVCEGSIEEAARDARYGFLKGVARRYGARYVATAHTADDQVETILYRILRGTGIAGLAGIPRTRELIPGTTLIRPLLTCRRRDVLEYLHELRQSYVEDETNRDNVFARNRIRNELLPQLAEQYNTRVDDAILRLGSLAEETSVYIDAVADGLIERHVSVDEHSVEINCIGLCDVPALIVRTLLIRIWRKKAWPEQGMGYQKWHQLAEVVRAPTDQEPLALPGGVTAIRDKHCVRLRSHRPTAPGQP
jgi:tRNA(Ile)-lysidine synthase